MSALDHPTAAAIVRTLGGSPIPLTVEQIARAIGRGPRQTWTHLGLLRDDGTVANRRAYQCGPVLYRLTAKAKRERTRKLVRGRSRALSRMATPAAVPVAWLGATVSPWGAEEWC